MSKIKSYIVLFFLHSFSFSQTRINDAGMWLSLASNYKIHSNQEIFTMVRLKQYENFTEFNSWRIYLGYGYKISPFVKLSVRYAFNSARTKKNFFRSLHQYYIRLDYKRFINKYFTLHNRIIFQHTTHRFLSDINDNAYKPYYRTDFRERIGLSYKLSSKSEIYLHNEWMLTLSVIPVEFRRNRLYAGYERKFTDRFSSKFYFVLQSSFHKRKSPNTNYFIFGMDLNFNIN